MPVTAAIIGGSAAAIQGGLGVAQIISGNSEAKKNVFPQEQIPQDFFTNQALANYYAQSGLSGEAKQALNTNADRGLTNATSTALQSGQGLNAIGDYFSNYLGSLGDIAVQDSALQDQKVRELYGINNELGNQKLNQYYINKLYPFQTKAADATQKAQSGLQNIGGALSGVMQTAASYGTAKLGAPIDTTAKLASPTSDINPDWFSSTMNTQLGGTNQTGFQKAQSNISQPINLGQNNYQYGVPTTPNYNDWLLQQFDNMNNPLSF